MEEFKVEANSVRTGTTYALHPLTKKELKDLYPDRNLFISQIFLGVDYWEGPPNMEESQRQCWSTLVEMLAGVGVGEFDKNIPVVFHFPKSGNSYKL